MRAPRFPAALVLVVAAIAASWALDDVSVLLPAAAGIVLVSFADEILTARSFAGRHDQQRERLPGAYGVAAANAAAGLTRGFPIAASGSRTSVNDAMGARTQLAGLAAAATVAVILLFLTAPIQYLPKAVLGAVIVSAAVGLIEPGAWRPLASVDPVEAAIAGVTTGGVIAFGVLEALIVAVGLSIIDVVRRSSRPHDAVLGWVEQLGRYADVSLHPSAEVTPGVVVYRLDDRLAFVNAGYVKGRVQEAVRAAPQPVSWLAFDAEAVTHVDSTGLAALEALVQSLERQGITLIAARLKAPMRERFDDGGLTDTVGRERFHATVREAVDACAASMNHATPRSVDTPPAAH